jgi:CubicO group peptidase (beta-lactamase class C family)
VTPLPLPLAAPEEIGFSSARLARLGAVMRSEIERGRLPGAVALIARRGRLGFFESFGQRDAASGAPMRTDAIFRIYSMTKPITSVAAMMLWEEGRFLLSDPVAKYLPELSDLEVAVERGGEIERVPVERDLTIQDLLRHTSGLTYEFRGSGPVHKMYMGAKVYSRAQNSADQVATLGRLPLLHQPGTRWEYGRSTDVVGRLVEVLSGQPLSAFFEQHILAPLGMTDTAFHVPPRHHSRLAEAFGKDPDSGAAVQLLEVRDPPKFESGGGGLTSTASDYARFLQMLLDRGTFDGHQLLSRKTIELMTADHWSARSAATRPRLRVGICGSPSCGNRAGAGLGRTVFLGRPRRHHLLGRSSGGDVRAVAHPGAGAARLLPHAIPRSGLFGVCRLGGRLGG